MRILVTGGLGYIGSHTVVELLQKNHEVIILDNLYNSSLDVLSSINQITGKKPVFYEGDIGNAHLIHHVFSDNGKIDCCIHFAGFKVVNESLEKPLEFFPPAQASTAILPAFLFPKKHRKVNVPIHMHGVKALWNKFCLIYTSQTKHGISSH